MGRKHEDDIEEWELPEAAAYLYQWFWELSSGRPVSQAGFLAIPSSEILAWCQLSGIRLRSWELDALRQLDAAFLREMGK